MGVQWLKEAPKCAFDADGKWLDSNWDCQSLAILRTHPWATESHSNDQTIWVVPFDGDFVVLGFYKSRHHVETAIYVSEDFVRPLSLPLLEALLERGAPND